MVQQVWESCDGSGRGFCWERSSPATTSATASGRRDDDEPTGVIMVGSNSEDDDDDVVVVVMVVSGFFELKDQKVWNFGTWSIVEDDWAV